MTAQLPHAFRLVAMRWGYRLNLIRYCVHCDGSFIEAQERGRPFRADRWVFHRQHERHNPPRGEDQGTMRTDLPRTGNA